MDCRVDQDITTWLLAVRDDKGRIVKDDEGNEVWTHNHIEAGWNEAQLKPTLNPAFPDQSRSWSKATWQKRHARLVNSVVTYY